MTHDPFCTRSEVPYDPWRPCYCDVIAKVRADTLDKAAQRVEENALVGMTLTPKEVRMILAAIRGES